MNTYKALMKREFWEHKGSIYYTPAIMAAVFAVLLLIAALTGGGNISENGIHINLDNPAPDAMAHVQDMPSHKRQEILPMILQSSNVAFGFTLLLISLFYSLGSLYDERKDKSILFWKSLPISDTATVVSKFVGIVLMVPVLYFAAITVFQLFLMLFMTVSAWIGGSSGAWVWQDAGLFSVIFNTFFSLIMASLWLAPLWGWCMLASSWAKKAVFLWATLPVVMVIMAESWIFGSHDFAEMVGSRLGQGFAIQNSFISQYSDEGPFELPVTTAMESLTSVDLWIGLVVTLVFLAGATYIRRYRDES